MIGTKMQQIVHLMVQRLEDDRGATAVEYGMIVALIAAIIVATVALVGLDVLGAFQTIEGAI